MEAHLLLLTVQRPSSLNLSGWVASTVAVRPTAAIACSRKQTSVGYSITLSARCSSDGGIDNAIAFAVLRLITARAWTTAPPEGHPGSRLSSTLSIFSAMRRYVAARLLAGPYRHEATFLDLLGPFVDGRQAVLRRELDDRLAIKNEVGVGREEERIGTTGRDSRERVGIVAIANCLENELDPELAGSFDRFGALLLVHGVDVFREQDCDVFASQARLLQELHSLGRERAVRRDEDARHVATRLRKALDESDRDGIEVTVKDDRDGRRRFLGRACRAASDDEDEIDALRDELAGERGGPVRTLLSANRSTRGNSGPRRNLPRATPRKEGRQEFVILVARSRPQDANAVDATRYISPTLDEVSQGRPLPCPRRSAGDRSRLGRAEHDGHQMGGIDCQAGRSSATGEPDGAQFRSGRYPWYECLAPARRAPSASASRGAGVMKPTGPQVMAGGNIAICSRQ